MRLCHRHFRFTPWGGAVHLQAQVDSAILDAGDLHVAPIRDEVWPHFIKRCIDCLWRQIWRLTC